MIDTPIQVNQKKIGFFRKFYKKNNITNVLLFKDSDDEKPKETIASDDEEPAPKTGLESSHG